LREIERARRFIVLRTAGELIRLRQHERSSKSPQIETARGDLLSLNDSAADPSEVSTQAAARAGSLQAPPAYSPLGDIFGALLSNVPTGLAAESQGRQGFGTGLFAQPKGSVKVIN